MNNRNVVQCGLICLFFVGAPDVVQAALDPSSFAGLRARSIGTAQTSGRISAIDATATEPPVIFVGAASGGVWRSIDAGTTFAPVFDEHPQSIGAIRIDPSNSKTIWVGTGESWVRNSVGAGSGVFKSVDGGDHWKLMGLEQSERIAEIVVSPDDSNLVYVCATGALWNDSEQRGVYRSRDGGSSWELVLRRDAGTGCSDLAMDPRNPNVLYAGMWSFRRAPDFFTSGGPGSGMFRSFDGGDHWTELTEGLPSGEKGRISLAIAPSKSQVVYAIVESSETALYRSDDMGNHWQRRNDSTNITMRPFYFGELKVDPRDSERVYRPGFITSVSTDGGKTFSGFAFTGPHPDHHALWIHPDRPNQLLLGTDGGLYQSQDSGGNWNFNRNLPISQFYHVSVDQQQPYQVYGGLQDNGTWTAPSRGGAGIRNRDWESVGFGDGFWSWADPQDPQIVYSEYQGGKLLRVDRRTGEVKNISITQGPGQERLRFNWNTPLILTPSGRLLVGSQYLHSSSDRGESWSSMSPDLTTDDPKLQRQASSGGLSRDNSSAENHSTIYSIAESPLDARQIWVGSDDGRLHLTRDDGKTWADRSPKLKDVPAGAWISRVEASPHAAGTAFVTLDQHRRGDFRTWVLRTDDFGANWRLLDTTGVSGWAWVIKQDPVRADLLFLGTEHGLFISLDGGLQWTAFRENLPQVAVHDLVIHPREHDLVIATHGRGVYIIDDLTPLRALDAAALGASAAMLPSRPAVQFSGGPLQEFGGADEFMGSNPPDAAIIAFHQDKRHLFGDLKVNVYDQGGKLLTTLAADKRRGMVRVEWPMRLKAPRFPPSTQLVPAMVGPRVAEGEYRVELIKGSEKYSGRVQVVADPRSPHSPADRLAQRELATALYVELGQLTYLADSLSELQAQLRALLDQSGMPAADLRRLLADLQRLSGQLAATSTEGMLSGEEQLRERYGQLYGAVAAYDGRPSNSQRDQHLRLKSELDQSLEKGEQILGSELDALNRKIEKAGGVALKRLDRAVWEARDPGTGSTAGALTALLGSWRLH